jgi:hypothetical protein
VPQLLWPGLSAHSDGSTATSLLASATAASLLPHTPAAAAAAAAHSNPLHAPRLSAVPGATQLGCAAVAHQPQGSAAQASIGTAAAAAANYARPTMLTVTRLGLAGGAAAPLPQVMCPPREWNATATDVGPASSGNQPQPAYRVSTAAAAADAFGAAVMPAASDAQLMMRPTPAAAAAHPPQPSWHGSTAASLVQERPSASLYVKGLPRGRCGVRSLLCSSPCSGT